MSQVATFRRCVLAWYGTSVRWLFAVVLVASTLASAEERYALIIGANSGWELDKPLRHAQSDAERVAGVLIELGQFPKERVTVLREPDTAMVRQKLDALGQAARTSNGPSLVFVYYSGHADSTMLHLR